MKTFRIFIFLYLIVTGFTYSQSKNSTLITGKILDQSNQPVEDATIYINNTSIFCKSDSLGNFQIEIPIRYMQTKITVDRLGYFRKEFSTNEDSIYTVILESKNLLTELVVTSKHDKDWAKNLKYFKILFFGKHDFLKYCKIENPEILNITKEKNRFFAESSQPLIFKNFALGYKVIVDFEYLEKKSNSTQSKHSNIRFVSFPDSLLTKKMLKNRELLYRNSLNGYLYQLVNNRKTKDYEIYNWLGVNYLLYSPLLMTEISLGNITPFEGKANLSFDQSSNRYTLQVKDHLLLFFRNSEATYKRFSDVKYEFISVEALDGKIIFDQNGNSFSKNKIIKYGVGGYSVSMPNDFIPTY